MLEVLLEVRRKQLSPKLRCFTPSLAYLLNRNSTHLRLRRMKFRPQPPSIDRGLRRHSDETLPGFVGVNAATNCDCEKNSPQEIFQRGSSPATDESYCPASSRR